MKLLYHLAKIRKLPFYGDWEIQYLKGKNVFSKQMVSQKSFSSRFNLFFWYSSYINGSSDNDIVINVLPSVSAMSDFFLTCLLLVEILLRLKWMKKVDVFINLF